MGIGIQFEIWGVGAGVVVRWRIWQRVGVVVGVADLGRGLGRMSGGQGGNSGRDGRRNREALFFPFNQSLTCFLS